MDIMDTAVGTVVQSCEIHEEADMTLILKVINLKSKQKELVNKVLDASDQCQEIIDMILSSTNAMLDLVQKIIRTNIQDLNLLRKVTELNNTEWDLFRKVIHLCDGKKCFIYKFMDWYLNDKSLDFPCSCSGVKGVELVGKDGPYKEKKHNDTVRQIHSVVSSYASRQGNSSEKCRTHLTNQGTSTELGKSCRENGFSLCETGACTENRSVTKQVNFTEKADSSAEYRSGVVAQRAQPTMTVKHLLSYERLYSGSSHSSEDVFERSVSHIELSDFDVQQKTMEELDARDNGNSTLAVTVVCGASSTREDVIGTHEEVSLNAKSAIPPYENMEVKEEQMFSLGTNHNCHSRGVKESVQELPNIGVNQAITPLLPKQNMDMEVHEQQIYSGSLQGNLSDVLTSHLSAVESSGIQSQNDILNDCCVPVSGRTETQLDPSGKLFSKRSEEFVLKDCYIKLENIAHALRSKKTVNLKDLESPQGNRMKKSTSENEALYITNCGIKGSSNVSLSTKRKKDTRLRCYGNNAKNRRTQTSEDLGFQENTEHVLGGNEAVNLKDQKRLQENEMKENVTEDKTLTVTDCGFKGVSNTFFNKMRKRDIVLRCYTNNAKKRTQISKGQGSQDAAVKEKIVVEGHSDFEDFGCDKGKTCSGFIIDAANCKYQNLSSKDLCTVQFACTEGMLEDTQFTGGCRQLQHRVPEIQNPEVMCREEGSYQSIGNVQKGNAVCLGKVAIYEGSAGKCIGETNTMRLRVKPEFSEQTGMLWRPLSREAEKENVLGIQLQPVSLEQVGSLKWAQFTTYIDHPYAEVNFMCSE